MRLAAQAKGGYYPTPERVVDMIADLIHTPTGYYYRERESLRILDPCCGAGDALQRLVEGLSRPNALSMETFGIELHRDRAEEAEARLGHVLAADLFATSIANGAFGLLFLNPPYDYDSEDKRTEHAFLTQTTRYLAEDGLLVFIVPRQRLAVSAPVPPPPTTGGYSAGPFPTRSGRSSTRWCCSASARPTPFPTPQPRAWCWSGRWGSRSPCAPTPTRSSPRLPRRRATSYSQPGPSTRWRLPPRRGGRGCGASTEITDTLWPCE